MMRSDCVTTAPLFYTKQAALHIYTHICKWKFANVIFQHVFRFSKAYAHSSPCLLMHFLRPVHQEEYIKKYICICVNQTMRDKMYIYVERVHTSS